MTLNAVKGIEMLRDNQGTDNVWVCGSYSLYGMPLLENACSSGLHVAEMIDTGVKRPWKVKIFYILTQRSKILRKNKLQLVGQQILFIYHSVLCLL